MAKKIKKYNLHLKLKYRGGGAVQKMGGGGGGGWRLGVGMNEGGVGVFDKEYPS